MPGLRVAVASGNWSSPSTWDGGYKPVAGDTVASNNYTITIDENFTIKTLTNSAFGLISAIPILSSNTAQLLVSNFDGSAWQAFDGNGSSYNYGTISGNTYLGYNFITPVVLNKYNITSWSTALMPTAWLFQGWDGTTWITLDSVTGASTNTYTSALLANTTAYTQYRILFTSAIGGYYRIIEIGMYEATYSVTTAVSGGTFNLNSGVNITMTSGTSVGATTLITYAGAGTSTINSNLINSDTVTGVTSFIHSGTGVLNVNGAVRLGNVGNGNYTLNMSGTGTLNITGTVGSTGGSSALSAALRIANTCTVNIIGNVVSSFGTNAYSIWVVSGTNSPINITGNVYSQTYQPNVVVNGAGTCIMNITGNVYYVEGSQQSSAVISITNSSQLYITGNVTGYGGYIPIQLSGAVYFRVVGSLINNGAYAVSSTSTTAINLFTGPFICSMYGGFPYLCIRMHLIPTSNSYFEFRDETTNGALSPGAIAPATRLYSPSTVVDAPATSNVRNGVVYALGTRTGTMVVPTANKVRVGVAVDNTVGTAVLTVADVVNAVWGAMSSGLTTSGSIGERTKNSITAAALGDQLAAFN